MSWVLEWPFGGDACTRGWFHPRQHRYCLLCKPTRWYWMETVRAQAFTTHLFTSHLCRSHLPRSTGLQNRNTNRPSDSRQGRLLLFSSYHWIIFFEKALSFIYCKVSQEKASVYRIHSPFNIPLSPTLLIVSKLILDLKQLLINLRSRNKAL